MKVKYSLRNFLAAYILLLILIPTALIMGNSSSINVGEIRSKASSDVNKLVFVPQSQTLTANQSADFEIRFNNSPIPESLDLVLSFNPEVIRIEDYGPVNGNAYQSYKAHYYDNVAGTVGLSGKSPNNYGDVFAAFKVKAVNSGDAEFRINFLKTDKDKINVELPNITVK